MSDIDSDEEDSLRASPTPSVRDGGLPQHQIEVQLGHLTFSSLICSGNMARAEIDEDEENEYNVWTTPDCAGSAHVTTCRSWFYFAVRGGQVGETIGITVMNSNIQNKLYKKGYKPVWRGSTTSPRWVPLPKRVYTSVDDEDYQIRWEHTFTAEEEVQFAFCYPSSLEESEERIAACEQAVLDPAVAEKIYFKSETLMNSLEGRPMRLLTLSSPAGMRRAQEPPIPELFPEGRADGARTFKGKPIIFISCRVHPGETPAQHVFNGLLDFLMRTHDPRAAALRARYVFKLVPILNPDGVARGHYRTDTLGQNLNRFYHDPTPELHPTIYAVKKYLLERAREGLLHMYIDLHAHATRRGCFVFGNNTATTESLIETVTFAKLIAMNSPVFDFNQCNYTERNMNRKDRRDGLSKSGSGRVGIYRETGLTHIYTLECNYNTGLTLNAIKAAKGKGERLASPPREGSVDPKRYTQDDFEQLGRAVCVAMLDQVDANPWSRLGNTRHKSLEGIRKWVQNYIERSRRRDGKSIVSSECGEEIETDFQPLAAELMPEPEPEPEPEPAPAPRKRRPQSGPTSARSSGRRGESRMLERERLKASRPQEAPHSARRRMGSSPAAAAGGGAGPRARSEERPRSPGSAMVRLSHMRAEPPAVAEAAEPHPGGVGGGAAAALSSRGLRQVEVRVGARAQAPTDTDMQLLTEALATNPLAMAAARVEDPLVKTDLGVHAPDGWKKGGALQLPSGGPAGRSVGAGRVRPNRSNTAAPAPGPVFGRRALGKQEPKAGGALGGPLFAAQQRRAAAAAPNQIVSALGGE